METMWHQLSDDLGPSKIVFIHDPAVGLDAIAVVDNVAAGPAIGGCRMAPDVGLEEVFRLARAMTFKNASAGLPHGGCKAGIIADPAMDPHHKEQIVRAFGRALREVEGFIPGPDMGTDETCMAYIHDEIGRAVGLPRVLGGIPLDEIGATGFGLAICAEVAQEYAGIELKKARVAIQGFGAVGRHAARFLVERGATIVAVSDSRGAVHNPDGLDLEPLLAHKAESASVHTFSGGAVISHDELVAVACDVWIPAARPDALNEGNIGGLQARLVVPGANIPATPGAERALHERGVTVIPDYIANAGGVICASVEYHGGTEAQAFAAIAEKIAGNTRTVLTRSQKGFLPRQAADAVARERVAEAMTYRLRGQAPPRSPRPSVLDL